MGDIAITGYRFVCIYFDGKNFTDKDLGRMGRTKDFVAYPGREDDERER